MEVAMSISQVPVNDATDRPIEDIKIISITVKPPIVG
ncbi:hypothetical protein MXB_4469 [Myxobolus squamalis]|nr:hypothetical protein MXB_4469 [Myxobolus squamalis]